MRITAAIDIFALAERTVERPAPGAAPTAFRIWRPGSNPTDKGDTIFSVRSADALMTMQAERGNLFSIDVDHLSLSPTAPPESRKAVGWHRLAVRPDENGELELWAVDVEWTDIARIALQKTPPEYRYFSPAYDVDAETREVIGYLNLALTNNPATWSINSLATRGTEQKIMKMEDVLAALKEMAEGDDDEQKEKAARMIRAAEGEDEKEPDGDEGKDEEKKDAEGEDEKDEDEKKDTAAIAASRASDPVVLELATVVQSMRSELDAMKRDKEADERTRLLASRGDFAPELLAVLKTAPIATVRDAVKRLPIAAKRDPAAPARVQPTRGDTQGDDRSARLPPEEKRKLDEQMGLTRRTDSIRREGSRVLFGVLTREDAQRRAAGGKAVA